MKIFKIIKIYKKLNQIGIMYKLVKFGFILMSGMDFVLKFQSMLKLHKNLLVNQYYLVIFYHL